MLGRLEFVPGARGRGAIEDLYGLRVLRVSTDPEGRLGGYRLSRAGAVLRRGRAVRILLPEEFSRWEMMKRFGLCPVDPTPFLHFCAPELAVEGLRRRDMDPGGATVALSGSRVDGAMARAAMRLCPRVRRLVIRAAGGEGLALRLWEEYGVPVLPPEEPAHLGLTFQPGGWGRGEDRLTLYGRKPNLCGGSVTLPTLRKEDRADISLLCALWEGGRLDAEGLKFT